MADAITKYIPAPRDGGADAYAEMEEDDYGEWVSLEDHQARIAELEGVVRRYGEQARLCRLIHSEGDAARQWLSQDGGKLAKDTLKGEPNDE